MQFEIISANGETETGWNLYSPSYDSGECLGNFETLGAAAHHALVRSPDYSATITVI
jgi:hypothetical protein